MKICCRCHEEKNEGEFYKRLRAKDGLSSSCKKCLSEDYTTSRNKRKEHYIETARQLRKQRFKQFADWKAERGCVSCGETEPVCLELHHLDPNKKEFTISKNKLISWERLMEEAKKCVVVCSNCHKKIHAGLVDLEKLGL